MIENIVKLKNAMRINNKNFKSMKELTRFEYNRKEIDKSSKAVIAFLNIFYLDLRLVNYFKKWHKYIIHQNIEEINQVMHVVKEDVGNIKLRNFGQILKNKYNQKLKQTFSGLMKRISRKNEFKIFNSKVLATENFYNNKLLRTYRGLYKLHRIKIYKNIFLMKFKSRRNNFFCNKIANYFYLWKCICERINIFPLKYLQKVLLLLNSFVRITYIRKLFFMMKFKQLINQINLNNRKIEEKFENLAIVRIKLIFYFSIGSSSCKRKVFDLPEKRLYEVS